MTRNDKLDFIIDATRKGPQSLGGIIFNDGDIWNKDRILAGYEEQLERFKGSWVSGRNRQS